jgi:hypothetical protein
MRLALIMLQAIGNSQGLSIDLNIIVYCQALTPPLRYKGEHP